MAKQNRNNTGIRGTIDDKVYFETKKGKFVRKAIAAGLKKDEPELKRQYSRTGYLNKLAGTVNRMMKEHCPVLKTPDFYPRILQRFRQEPLDNRFLLLRQLTGLELHPKNRFPVSAGFELLINQSRKQLSVTLQMLTHPTYNKRSANCYYLVPVLLTWTVKGNADIEVRNSAWIPIDHPLPQFEFTFPMYADTVHWLLGLQLMAGNNNLPVNSMWGEGMKFIEAGTFDVKDKRLLEERKNPGKQLERPSSNKPVIERVQPKGWM